MCSSDLMGDKEKARMKEDIAVQEAITLMAPGDTADWPARLIVEASELNIDGTVYQNVILKLDIQPGADYLRIEDGVNIDILRVSSDSLPATCLQTAGYIGNL